MGKKAAKFNTENETLSTSRDIGCRKKLHRHDIKSFKPLTVGHEEFLEMFYSNTSVISLSGVAGAGKTYMAMAAAISEVVDSSTAYDRLIIIRSIVEVRSVGFLPGDISEKIAVYEQPYSNVLKELMNFNDPYSIAKTLGYIEFHPTSYLRGMTFDNAIIIVDECENMDYKELSTVITRTGVNSRCIFIGDDKQEDLSRQRQVSGFKKFREVLSRMPERSVGMVEFGIDDIVRSGVVKDFIIAEMNTDF